MSTWNYRIGTYLHKYNNKEVRLYKIVSVYYDENKVINGYGDRDFALIDYESISDMKYDLEKSLLAYDKPILNLDNFPNEWKEDKI